MKVEEESTSADWETVMSSQTRINAGFIGPKNQEFVDLLSPVSSGAQGLIFSISLDPLQLPPAWVWTEAAALIRGSSLKPTAERRCNCRLGASGGKSDQNICWITSNSQGLILQE
ncbi:hypothetical protein AMECASPLE_000567 [Ameca splendens]|uniref:Uncharacterized protein n=1 Tax=Ameca splendens TaxID=208324 RepID=A0ABV0XAR4_9TELE